MIGRAGQVEERGHVSVSELQSQLKASCWAANSTAKAETTAPRNRQYSKHIFYRSVLFLKTASLHSDWQPLDVTVTASIGISLNIHLYKDLRKPAP